MLVKVAGMNRMRMIVAVVSGILAGGWVWSVTAQTPDSYAKIDAAALVRSPQNAWARAILFSDVLESPPAGRQRRLDRRNYLPMRLKTAGTVWVPEELSSKFQPLAVGGVYSFAGTVDQITRRYYIIVDACYTLQTTADMREQWIDMLSSDSRAAQASKAQVSETVLQSLLLDAQNSLIQMARDSNLSVAQLIEAQTDGGHRIAERIVAESLQGKLRTEHQTAEELMIGAVLALLQKQAVMDESARVAREMAASEKPQSAMPVPETVAPPPVAAIEPEPMESVPMPAEIEQPPVVVAAIVEEETLPVELPEEELPTPGPEAMTEDTVVEVVEPGAEDFMSWGEPEGESATEFLAESGTETVPASDDRWLDDLLPAAELAEEAMDGGPEASAWVPEDVVTESIVEGTPWDEDVEAGRIDFAPGLTLEEEMAAAELPEAAKPPLVIAVPEPEAPPPSSLLVTPLTGSVPDVVPMVSVEPTKAELAQQKKQEAIRLKQERNQARNEARRLALEEKKAIQEAQAAESARKNAEARKAREEAAVRKAAELQARKEAAQAEAEAKKAMQERSRQLAQEERDALEAVRRAEALAKKEEAARLEREQAEQRLAEIAARREAAEQALRQAEELRQAEMLRIQQEVEAQASAEAAQRQARLAEENAQKAESIRMAREVALHERRAAEEAAARIEEERAARQAAEERLAQMEKEIRQMEEKARQTESDVQQQRKAERAEAAETSRMTREQRRQEAAARQAEARAKKEAEAAAKAQQAAAAKTKVKPPPPGDPSELPEWMQPVRY